MKTTSLDMLLNERQEYPSPGRCIYCGDTERELTDEHITPYAIGGDGVIFRKASCKPCAKTINDEFEQHVLRSMWGPFRRRIEAPSRSRSKRKKAEPETRTITFRLLDDDLNEAADPVKMEVPIEKVPLNLPLWLLPPPGIVKGEPPSPEIKGHAWTRFRAPEGDALIAQVQAQTSHPGPIALRASEVNQVKLFRFLAKTAHAYAVAELGYDGFTHFATDIILGRSQNYCHLVGCMSDATEPMQNANVIELGYGAYPGAERSLVVIKVQVFGMYGTPIYLVAVGDRPATAQEVQDAKATPEGSWGHPRKGD